MSPLGKAVYRILRRQAALSEPRITYAELAAQLRDMSEKFEHIYHRSQELYAALGEVGKVCRHLELPSLPALVVRADTRRPGAAYFEGGCTGMVYRGEKISAWRDEVAAVKEARYPARVAGSLAEKT